MQLCEAIGSAGDRGAYALLAAFTEEGVRDAWGRAAHERKWFKAQAHCEVLVEWLLQPGHLPGAMEADLKRFWEALSANLPVPGTTTGDGDGDDGA